MQSYLIILIILIVFYFLGLYGLNYIKNKLFFNYFFVGIIFICYVLFVFLIYKAVGLKDWNFRNTLPTANVSPFMYLLTSLVLFFPKKIRNYLFVLISLLSFGMLGASILNCVSYIIKDFKLYLTIVLDTFAHALVSLYGVYLIKSGQARLDTKTGFVGGSIIVSVAIIMVILNLIFHTSFFGLSLYGEHNIYNVVISKSGLISMIVYFLGLIIILILGYIYQKILNKKICNE